MGTTTDTPLSTPILRAGGEVSVVTHDGVSARRAAAGHHATLNLWARQLGVGGVVVSAAGGLMAAAIGPSVVEILYGSDFRRSRVLAGLAGAAVLAGMIGLAITQILVARGHAGRLAVVWLLAVAVAGVSVLLTG